jgi:hypothetical protein
MIVSRLGLQEAKKRKRMFCGKPTAAQLSGVGATRE